MDLEDVETGTFGGAVRTAISRKGGDGPQRPGRSATDPPEFTAHRLHITLPPDFVLEFPTEADGRAGAITYCHIRTDGPPGKVTFRVA